VPNNTLRVQALVAGQEFLKGWKSRRSHKWDGWPWSESHLC